MTLQELAGGISLETLDTLQKDTCGEFFLNYSTSLALNYVAALASVVIAMGLKVSIFALAKQESHISLDAEEAAKMSKLFLSTYITLCIIILVAYGKIDGLPDFVRETLGIFNGPYNDFSSAWYGNVGNFLVVTFLLSFIISYMQDCYKLYFR